MATPPPSAKIDPAKVTKPIQLLGAWLAGLVIIDSTFLVAACHIQKPEWAAGLLIVAAVVYVPLFIVTIFILQTKYRPQLQEDSYYSKYLSKPQPLRQSRRILTRSQTPVELDQSAKGSAANLQQMLANED